MLTGHIEISWLEWLVMVGIFSVTLICISKYGKGTDVKNEWMDEVEKREYK